jgi:hypothetical protein
VLAILAAILIAALTVGWARSWYSVQLLDAESGKTAFRVEIDRSKVAGDFAQAARTVQTALRTENKETKKAQ